MSYTADSIRDFIRIRIVIPDSIRIRFERKQPIRKSLPYGAIQIFYYYYYYFKPTSTKPQARKLG